MLLAGLELTFDREIATHRFEADGAHARRADGDVAAHGASFDMADVVAAVHVAAHGLQPQRALHVAQLELARHAADVQRAACPHDAEVAAHRLRLDAALARDGDLEVDAEPRT